MMALESSTRWWRSNVRLLCIFAEVFTKDYRYLVRKPIGRDNQHRGHWTGEAMRPRGRKGQTCAVYKVCSLPLCALYQIRRRQGTGSRPDARCDDQDLWHCWEVQADGFIEILVRESHGEHGDRSPSKIQTDGSAANITNAGKDSWTREWRGRKDS